MNTPLISFLASLKFAVDVTSANTANKAINAMGKSIMALGVMAISGSIKAMKFGDEWVENTARAEIAIRQLGIKSLSHFKSMQDAAERVGIAGSDMVAGFEKLKQMKFELGSGATNLFQLMNPSITSSDDVATIMEKMGLGAKNMLASGTSSIEVAARAEAAGMDPRMARIMAEQGTEWQQQLERFKQDNKGLDTQGPKTAYEIAQEKAHNQAALFGKLASTDAANNLLNGYKEGTERIQEAIKNGNDEQIIHMAMLQEIFGVNLEMAESLRPLAVQIGDQIESHLGLPINNILSGIGRIANSLEHIEHPIDAIINSLGVLGSSATWAM